MSCAVFCQRLSILVRFSLRLTPETDAPGFCRRNAFRLALPDELSLRLGHIAEQLQDDVRNHLPRQVLCPSGVQQRHVQDGHADPALLGKIGPFSMKNLNVYNPAYLAGFFAERYTIGLKDGFSAVRPQIESRMEAGIRSSLGYDTYRMMSYHHTHRSVRFKHILLPVWLSSYRYGGKTYSFMVNGESGKIAGRAPISALKVALTVLASIAALVLLCFLIAFADSSLTAAPSVDGLLPEASVAEVAPSAVAELPDALATPEAETDGLLPDEV